MYKFTFPVLLPGNYKHFPLLLKTCSKHFFGAGGMLRGLWDPGIEPGPLAMKVPSPNHWTTREFPIGTFFFFFWLYWVFVAACRLSLVAASGGYS